MAADYRTRWKTPQAKLGARGITINGYLPTTYEMSFNLMEGSR